MYGEKVDIAIRKVKKLNKNIFQESSRLANDILMENECPFLMKGFFCCESENYIYQAIKLAEGGDLTSFLEKTVGKGDDFRKLGE